MRITKSDWLRVRTRRLRPCHGHSRSAIAIYARVGEKQIVLMRRTGDGPDVFRDAWSSRDVIYVHLAEARKASRNAPRSNRIRRARLFGSTTPAATCWHVGGRYELSQFNRATQAQRQTAPASAYVYPAIGTAPSHDNRRWPGQLRQYTPHNYETTTRAACLIDACRVAQHSASAATAWHSKVIDVPPLRRDRNIPLSATHSARRYNLEEQVASYAVFPTTAARKAGSSESLQRDGSRCGRKRPRHRVISQQTARTNDLLQAVIRTAPARRGAAQTSVWRKTGTTANTPTHGSWLFALHHCGVWVGFDTISRWRKRTEPRSLPI